MMRFDEGFLRKTAVEVAADHHADAILHVGRLGVLAEQARTATSRVDAELGRIQEHERQCLQVLRAALIEDPNTDHSDLVQIHLLAMRESERVGARYVQVRTLSERAINNYATALEQEEVAVAELRNAMHEEQAT